MVVKIQGKKYREKIQGGPGGSCEGILKLYRQDDVVIALCVPMERVDDGQESVELLLVLPPPAPQQYFPDRHQLIDSGRFARGHPVATRWRKLDRTDRRLHWA